MRNLANFFVLSATFLRSPTGSFVTGRDGNPSWPGEGSPIGAGNVADGQWLIAGVTLAREDGRSGARRRRCGGTGGPGIAGLGRGVGATRAPRGRRDPRRDAGRAEASRARRRDRAAGRRDPAAKPPAAPAGGAWLAAGGPLSARERRDQYRGRLVRRDRSAG